MATVTSLEEVIRNVIERDMFDDPTDEIAEAVRAWLVDNAVEQIEYDGLFIPSVVLAETTSLDKFGGDDEQS